MGRLLDKTIFKEEMKKLESIFDYDFNVNRAKLYYSLLKTELSDEAFVDACNQIAKTERFFPVPATILANSIAVTKEEILKKYGF